MGKALMNYLNERLLQEHSIKRRNETLSTAGPVITISREVGCNGIKLAKLIASRLDERKMISEWKVLSKGVFYQSAKELDMEPERVRKIFKKDDRYQLDDILKAFSDRQYKSERKIIKTVTAVVRTFAVDGFSIIVGRAGHIIARDIQNALHIRVAAPLEYRIHNIMENNQLNREEAIIFIKRVEKERTAFRRAISKENLTEESFDMCINRASFSNDDIVDIIGYAVDKKKILIDFK